MKILIVGLGVIGGGYAMALKEAGYSEVYGIDTNEETLKKAKEMKIIKEGFTREDEIKKSPPVWRSFFIERWHRPPSLYCILRWLIFWPRL